MATTLVDTRRPIIAQIEASWNKWVETEVAAGHFPAARPVSAEEFKKGETPWTTNQSVLERNAVHANKLIRLYIALNIDVAERWAVWKFFEVDAGVVGWVKEHIKSLKRVQKVLKTQQELGLELSDATDLFKYRNDVCMWAIEKQLKTAVVEAKAEAAKAAKAAAKAAKAEAAKAAKAAAKAAKKLAAAQAKVEVKAAKAAKAKKHKRLVQFVKKANEYIGWCRANKLEDLMVGMIEFCPPNKLYEVPTQSQKTLGRVAHEY